MIPPIFDATTGPYVPPGYRRLAPDEIAQVGDLFWYSGEYNGGRPEVVAGIAGWRAGAVASGFVIRAHTPTNEPEPHNGEE